VRLLLLHLRRSISCWLLLLLLLTASIHQPQECYVDVRVGCASSAFWAVPEAARVLPQALLTEAVATANVLQVQPKQCTAALHKITGKVSQHCMRRVRILGSARNCGAAAGNVGNTEAVATCHVLQLIDDKCVLRLSSSCTDHTRTMYNQAL
jgi:hypothetical protein